MISVNLLGDNMKNFFFVLCTALLFSSISFAQYPNIRVDGQNSNQPEEVSITLNFNDPSILAAGANINHFFVSTDSGNTWSDSRLTSSYGVWGDPSLIYDKAGNLYFAHLSNPPFGYWIDRIVVQKSTDNGTTWNDGVGVGFIDPKNQDKEWLAADMHSQFKGNIYMTWTEFDDYGSSNPNDSSRIKFSRTTDAGETWSSSITISDVSGNCIDDDLTTEGAVPCVGPNGEIYVSWAGPLGLVFDKSTDGGITWGEDKFITDIPGGWAFDVSGISRCNGLPITMCDTSGGAYNGNIYICYGAQVNGITDTDVLFVKSTDGGVTWTTPLTVNDDNTSRHQFFPWMTIDQTTGTLWGVFYDRRNTTGVATDVYVVKSTDGGDTFENLKVSESSFTPNSGVFFGDYSNIIAYDKQVYPIWMRLDNFDLSVWIAQITDSVKTTSSENQNYTPDGFKLFQNYPNPFNPSTTISYEISEKSYITLKVYDVIGNEVAILFKGEKEAGVHEINFSAIAGNGNELVSGIYLYKLQAGDRVETKKMILLR